MQEVLGCKETGFPPEMSCSFSGGEFRGRTMAGRDNKTNKKKKGPEKGDRASGPLMEKKKDWKKVLFGQRGRRDTHIKQLTLSPHRGGK